MARHRHAAVNVRYAPASMYRADVGLGLWEHRGKVAAVGIGHSPTARRWDGRPETSVGAISLLALRRAIEDAGVEPSAIDGLVLDPSTTTGAHWPKGRPIPEAMAQTFAATDDPLDGVARLSAAWILKNMPELDGVRFAMYGPTCMTNAICVAAQAVGDGLAHTCLVLKAWHNFAGRYGQGGANAGDALPGNTAIRALWGTPACYGTALQFAEYCRKYGKRHEMMAPFIENSRRNGLLFPEGYWAQHRPEEITAADYNAARWIAKPANLFDNDLPIMAAAAYLFTTAERARHMRQKPVYILGHASSRTRARGLTPTLAEVEADTALTARKLYEGAGIGAADLSFENTYDGFTQFHHFHLEGLGYRGLKFGEGLDFYQTDISISGPNPVQPSGGNIGSGRTRFWMHTDCMQQLQGRAGRRQVTGVAPEVAVSGGPMPLGGDFIVWGATPD